MEVVVFGAGSLGSLVGGLLASEHAVTLVGREPHVSAIRENGLRIVGAIEETVRPDATTTGADLSADLAVVTVKAFDTEVAARTLATGTFDAVCSLQNGMGNEEALQAHLDVPVLAGTATYAARLLEPGVVECTGTGEIAVGAPAVSEEPGGDDIAEVAEGDDVAEVAEGDDVAEVVGGDDIGERPEAGGGPVAGSPAVQTAAERAVSAFRAVDLEATVASDMPRRLWTKLAVNAGINPVTALTDAENGVVLDEPARTVAREAARETARLARLEGIPLSNRAAVTTMESVAESTAANTSSMLQDVRDGRRTEIDAINGFVLERARNRSLAVPTNELLTRLVTAREANRKRS